MTLSRTSAALEHLGTREQYAIPGAMEVTKRRVLPDGGLIEFESAPAGWLTKKGTPRLKDYRAYHYCSPGGKGVRLPSVSTILDSICPKPGLAYWSEARGIEGAVRAVRLGLIDPEDPASAANAVAQVRAARLGADRARDTAAERGLNVHACLEHYMRTEEPPNPADHPAEYHGYLRAMTRWLLKTGIEPEAVEELVAHPEDGYAGRMDLRGRIDGVLTAVDAKTQERAGIYGSAHAQLSLYERAAVECGDDPADRLVVVVFAANGEFREMPADHPSSFADAALAWCRAIRPVDAMCEAQNRVEREARKVAA